MTDEVEITEQVSLEIERVAIQKARIRAKASMWSLDVAAFLFATLALLIILLFMRIGTEILTPLAVFGLTTGWLMGRRSERKLYQNFHNEELFKLTRELLEEKVKKANEQLQELYEQEKALRQELESEVNKRIKFTRILVHELKTPLTPIMAASSLLMEEVPEGATFRLAKSINEGALTLSNRIGQLIDIAKGEIGMLELDLKETNLLELIQRITEDMTPLSLSHKQLFNLELPVSLPPIWIDAERIRQVVVNLLDNSFKFTPEGGKIILRAKEKGNALIVEVEDTGPGISVDQKRHLFEAYYHSASESDGNKGLGLGLAMSRILIELHGGKIWMENQKSKGSMFGISIPLRATNQKE